MSKVFCYSPREVVLTFGGYTVAGWQSISVARSADVFKPVRGIRGKHTRVKNADTSCIITIPLLQTSISNDVFSRILELDTERGTGRIELTLSDLGGTSKFSSVEAYILGYPDVTFSDGFEYRQWKIFCQSTGTYIVGGNAQVENIFSSIFSKASGLANSAVDAVSNIF
jgi:hypothetical protein